MEERIIDDPRKIKVKTNPAGGVQDAMDALAPDPEEAGSEEEVLLEIPEGEDALDEDLIGLAPSQLEKELERRKKEAEEAAAERDRLLEAAEAKFQNGEFEEAEPLFSQALATDPACKQAQKGVWLCRTRDLTSVEGLLARDAAEEFAEEDEELRQEVLKALGGKLKAEREKLLSEAKPLRERVRGAQDERRGALVANRNYYRLRFALFAVFLLLFGIGALVSGQFILRVVGSVPAIVTGVFGGLAALDLIPLVFFARKLVVAQRLCRQNEELSSTEEGGRLERLEQRIELVSSYLETK